MHQRPHFLVGVTLAVLVAAVAIAQDAPPSASPNGEAAASGNADTAEQQPAAATPLPDPTTITKWIQELDSDSFATRVRATRQLVKAGGAAIEPLARELPEFGREAVTRGIYVLRQLTIQTADPSLNQAAAAALESLAQSKAATTSRTATSALHDIYELWYQQAQLQLRQSGAIFARTQIVTPRNAQQVFPSIAFGGQWHGKASDLTLISRVTDNRFRDTGTPWMLIFDGPQVTDAWLESIATASGVACLRLSSTQITNEGLKRMVQMPDLQAIELLYNDINDDCLDTIISNPATTRLRLIGNRISYEGADRLRQQAAHMEIDFRAGGFLGVACTDNPCRITLVQTNSAAARAGFRIDDVIVSYNGQAVNSMDELIRAIAKHAVGEKVTVEIERDGNRFSRELVLGKWD